MSMHSFSYLSKPFTDLHENWTTRKNITAAFQDFLTNQLWRTSGT